MAEKSYSVPPDAHLLKKFFSTSPIGIVVEDIDGTPLFVNPAFCSFLCFSEEELRRKHCVDFSPPEDAKKDWVLFQQLQAGSIDHYQLEKRYFRSDGSLVWGRLSISSLRDFSVPLVLAQVEDITDKKQAEEAVHASEERLALAQKAARMGTFEWNIQNGVNAWNSELEAVYGLPPGGFAGTQKTFEELVHSEDREGVKNLIAVSMESGEPTKGEWRAVWPDGSIHWVAGRWQVFKDDAGSPHRMVGVNINIDDRKRAEQALADAPRKLIEAHEEERAWLARELHDDITQRLALLAVEVDQWNRELPDSAFEFQGRIAHAKQRLSDLGNDIQALSHRLHSSKLEYLGLVAAAKSFCKELSEQQQVEIDFSHWNIPHDVPKEISLCLFRVLQESLQNAVKHSGVRQFKAELCGTGGEIQLTVSDLGVSFDPQDAMHQHGIGLISMRERMQIVRGEIEITSTPGVGTTVCARVPWHCSQQAIAG